MKTSPHREYWMTPVEIVTADLLPVWPRRSRLAIGSAGKGGKLNFE
jgi:hypothetical protein